MSEIVLDLEGIYEKAKSVAKGVVLGAPQSSYALVDVMPEDEWVSVLSLAFGSRVPLYATLNGCIEALAERKVTSFDIRCVLGAPPPGMAITAEDLRLVRDWLVVGPGLDEDDRQDLVDEETAQRGWVHDPARLSSLILAVVLVASEATVNR